MMSKGCCLLLFSHQPIMNRGIPTNTLSHTRIKRLLKTQFIWRHFEYFAKCIQLGKTRPLRPRLPTYIGMKAYPHLLAYKLWSPTLLHTSRAQLIVLLLKSIHTVYILIPIPFVILYHTFILKEYQSYLTNLAGSPIKCLRGGTITSILPPLYSQIPYLYISIKTLASLIYALNTRCKRVYVCDEEIDWLLKETGTPT